MALQLKCNLRNKKRYTTKNGKEYFRYIGEYDTGKITAHYNVKSWSELDEGQQTLSVYAESYKDTITYTVIN